LRTAARLTYIQNRYYDSHAGRFMSLDPIRFAGGLNLYEYCESNPVGLADPNGAVPVPVITGGIGAAAGAAWGGIGAWRRGENVWVGMGRGMVVGAVTGATGGGAGALTSRLVLKWLGGRAASMAFSGAAGGSVGGGLGDLAGQMVELSAGWSCTYDPLRTAFSATFGGIGGAFLWRPANAPWQEVTHWGGPIRPGSWVMVGGPTRFNWSLAGGPQLPYSYAAPIQATVKDSALKYPLGWESIKGLFGQRIYQP
jgi:hypothetical protein